MRKNVFRFRKLCSFQYKFYTYRDGEYPTVFLEATCDHLYGGKAKLEGHAKDWDRNNGRRCYAGWCI